MKKLAIISDSGPNLVNGVSRTLNTTIQYINNTNEWTVQFIHPETYKSFALPGYKEIPIVYNSYNQLSKELDEFKPTYIHIAVEGTLGITARKYCLNKKYNFTTAYHTKFPEFVEERTHIPACLTYKFVKWFHSPSSNVMVATDTLEQELRHNGFNNTFGKWSRGVDIQLFNPNYLSPLNHEYVLYVGRVSHEKNIEQFLQSSTDFKKVVVGDGPQLDYLKHKYPDVLFVGVKKGTELAAYYANAAAFVFPSKTDTFGLVMIEALAAGTPVAALDVSSPCDIITEQVGCLNNDLSVAIETAVKKDRAGCRNFVIENYTWEIATQQFLNNLVPVR